MFKCDSLDMAADIFTKTFPESKASTWANDLKLINIVDPTSSIGKINSLDDSYRPI